jgi:endoglucanase
VTAPTTAEPSRPSRTDQFKGFVHVAGGRLVDGSGTPLLLRGVGLGNWLLPEGYMWKFEPGGPLAPRQIEQFICDLVGSERADEFWTRFRDEFITEGDIIRIAAEGFNHVRVAINSRVLQSESGELLESGFSVIDRLIEWCRTCGIWVVLDLHGAPGGQTGANIDDSPHGLPELFTDPQYAEMTVKLWRAIAARYRDETVVAGYDLLNEPLPNEYQHLYAGKLIDLYKKLTAAVRGHDQNHLIIYEGTHWSTNWDIFTEVWDANSMLQCHKYWSPPDRLSVQNFVDRGRELALPVYMGETGENNLEWLQAAFQLYDDCGMSWNLWPWKKMQTVTSPCSVNPPVGWDALVAFARGVAAGPSATAAWAILTDFLDSLHISRCTYRSDVVNAVMRRAPLRLPAWGFSFRGEKDSYQTAGAKPLTGFRADDLVSLECATLGPDGAPHFDHTDGARRLAEDAILVCLTPGDWIAFDVEVAEPCDLAITVETQDNEGVATSSITSYFDNAALLRPEIDDAGGTETTRTTATAGKHTVRLVAATRAVKIRSLIIAPDTADVASAHAVTVVERAGFRRRSGSLGVAERSSETAHAPRGTAPGGASRSTANVAQRLPLLTLAPVASEQFTETDFCVDHSSPVRTLMPSAATGDGLLGSPLMLACNDAAAYTDSGA